jgi:hypothetical protein
MKATTPQPYDPGPSRPFDTTETPFPAVLGEPVLETLLSEISRYLAVVEFFRREGCEPCWS